MRPVSHQLLVIAPAVLSVLLVFLAATPLNTEFATLVPNIAWLMTLAVVTHYPSAWPRGVAFGLGLLQDYLFGTPLGTQALLTLLLVGFVAARAEQQQTPLFRLRWLHAAVVLAIWHVALWALIHLVASNGPSLLRLLGMSIINTLWYPLFYWMTGRMLAALPEAN